jgi:hypothetical protein
MPEFLSRIGHFALSLVALTAVACTESPKGTAPASSAASPLPAGHPTVVAPAIPAFDCAKGPPELRAPCPEPGQSCRYEVPAAPVAGGPKMCIRQWSCEASGDGIGRWADVSETCVAALPPAVPSVPSSAPSAKKR